MEQRISPWMMERTDLQGLNLKVLKWQDRPDKGIWTGDTAYVLKDLWSTYNGSWEYANDAKWTVPQWARETYLKPMDDPLYLAEGGADHHILGGCLDINGARIEGKGMLFTTTGISTFDLSKWAKKNTVKSGFANVEMFASSLYFPDQGKQGPWAWMPFGLSDVVYGAGMPYQHHVSFFAVWQEVSKDVTPDAPEATENHVYLPILTRIANEMQRFNDYVMRAP